MGFKIPDTPEELFREGKRNMSSLNRWVPLLVVVFIALMTVMTCFYRVEANEVGVIRRFGKFDRITNPGLRFKMPMGLEKVDKVLVQYVHKQEFGFRTLQAGVKTKYSSQSYNDEAIMLTGDLNVLNVTWIVQFRVKDPVHALFNIRAPLDTVRDISEAVMRQIIGDSSVNESLTTRRSDINVEVQKRMQEILDSYQSGIKIETVKLQDVNPPDQVKPSFNEVNEAKQDKEKVINQALEAYNKVIPQARGQAEKTIRESEGYALARVSKAEGDASKFIETFNAYKDAKDVTRRRMYLETMEQIMPQAGQVFVFEPEANGVLPLLNLNKGGTINE